MKNKLKGMSKIMPLLILFILCVIIPTKTSSAASVSKVTCQYKYSSYKQYAIISGKTSSGKTVWKYTSAKYPATELDAVTMKTKGNSVYILEGRKYIRLGKNTGRVLANRTVLPATESWGSPAMAISNSGNLYAIGYYDSVVYRISSSGKVIWKRNINYSDCYWPYKITLSPGKVNVFFDPPVNGKRVVVLKASNGKILKKYKG